MKFYEKSLTVDFLKGELMRTPIPTCKAWHEGMGATKGNLYIAGNSLCRATQTVIANGDGTYNNGQPKPISDCTKFLSEIRDYYWGDHIHGVTVKYQSKSENWNRLDHWMLGMYLRWQRELFGQDWMYGYNCWDGEFLKNTIMNDLYGKLTDGLLTLTVPIIPAREYTIWGDSPTGALMALGYSDNGKILNNYYHKVARPCILRRSQPFLLQIPALGRSDQYDGIKEYLTLFIQIPKQCKGVFVAEGNYAEVGDFNYGQNLERSIKTEIENISNWTTACTNRVIEGLSGNIISGQQFKKSIAWMQRVLSGTDWLTASGTRYEGNFIEGIWDLTFQQWVLNIFGNPMVIRGMTMPGIKEFNGEGVKEVEHRIREVLGYVV